MRNRPLWQCAGSCKHIWLDLKIKVHTMSTKAAPHVVHHCSDKPHIVKVIVNPKVHRQKWKLNDAVLSDSKVFGLLSIHPNCALNHVDKLASTGLTSIRNTFKDLTFIVNLRKHAKLPELPFKTQCTREAMISSASMHFIRKKISPKSEAHFKCKIKDAF